MRASFGSIKSNPVAEGPPIHSVIHSLVLIHRPAWLTAPGQVEGKGWRATKSRDQDDRGPALLIGHGPDEAASRGSPAATGL